MAIGVKGDFLGFYFNGHHSSEFGITRVSSSDRYEEGLLPTDNDTVVQIPGNDGTYFFGSDFTDKHFTIDFAFDGISELQLRKMRLWLGSKKLHELVFDETPYKVWKVKPTGDANLKYICFDSEEEWGEYKQKYASEYSHSPYYGNFLADINSNREKISSGRIYKGEGSVELVAYDPYAHCPNEYKWLDRYGMYAIDSESQLMTDNELKYLTVNEYNCPPWYIINNKAEWSESSGLLSSQGDYDIYKLDDDGLNGNVNQKYGYFTVYNCGDIPTHFKIKMTTFPGSLFLYGKEINSQEFKVLEVLNFKSGLVKKQEDEYIEIDTKINLIHGLDENGNCTGNLYNEYLDTGHFFTIPLSDNYEELRVCLSYTIPIDAAEISYDLLYI